MRAFFSWKLYSTILVTIIAVIFALPNLKQINPDSWLPSSKVKLGLDLQGGSHLLLQVDFKSYLRDQYALATDVIRKELRRNKIGYRQMRYTSENITFEPRKAEEIDQIRKLIFRTNKQLLIAVNDNKFSIIFNNDHLEDLKAKVVDQSIEIVRMRVDETGTNEPNIQRQGDLNILLQVPGLNDPKYLKQILGRTAKLSFHIVSDKYTPQEARRRKLPPSLMLVYSAKERGEALVINKKSVLTGDMLADARVGFDQYQNPSINFSLNNIGAKLFGEVTKNNVNKRLAIILDRKLLSAPVINSPILGGNGMINGSFSVQEANDLALLLRAGALPAPLKIIEERTVGPNLGADSIEAGKIAGFVGLAAVVIFMILTYGLLGIFANIALMLSLLYILAMLSMFHATLTLPGIAGIILTIGMAVDANVLIYERIREEFNNGATINYAIKQGFNSAFGTIADSNITTLIAAILLYGFGVGAIKGFAVTLTIGIIASMFSAIVVTKLLLDLWINICKPKKLGI